jgi:hypothetical protein
MGAHGAEKLLQDVQTYHDMHHEIVTKKMHQISPPRNGGKYGERACENPQCPECPKPRHLAVGFSSSRQEATILDDPVQLALLRGSRQTDQQVEERSSSPPPLPAADSSSIGSSSQQIEERSSSPRRQIAALTPPRVVTAPSELFDSNKQADIFISPHIPKNKKWYPIANSKLNTPPVDNVDFTHMIPSGLTRLLKRQGEQNDTAMYNLLA